ncbi:MAG: hypothetical protein NTZ33_12030 [Bacteroidetes bacterium]|nr:hypothetical protein [Bacteroidota bacterium]
MRKYISYISLFIILFNIGGYYIWFSVQQFRIQREIEVSIIKELKDKDLILIEVANNQKSEIRWIEPDKEFDLNGEMYDVVRIKFQKDRISYYCINDVKEEELIAKFKNTHNKKKEIDKNIKYVFNFQFFQQQHSIINNKYSSDFIFPSLVLLYKSKSIEIKSPPPKFII